jgi:7-carboxy-7-deazaguanine synthase
MRIAEIFYSVQGEGILLGIPSVFVRTSGCNLRCVWCDTPYTSWKPEGRERGLREILAAVSKYPAAHVVITGGEPFLAGEIEALTARLKKRKYHITIETAGTIFKTVACDLISLSPKLANSTPWKRKRGQFSHMHEERRLNLPVIQRFIDRYDNQLKFVVERRGDFAEIQTILKRLRNVKPAHVVIMAQGRTKKELRVKGQWIVAMCKARGFRYTPRLQIDLYGNRRGT